MLRIWETLETWVKASSTLKGCCFGETARVKVSEKWEECSRAGFDTQAGFFSHCSLSGKDEVGRLLAWLAVIPRNGNGARAELQPKSSLLDASSAAAVYNRPGSGAGRGRGGPGYGSIEGREFAAASRNNLNNKSDR
ncbi:hypothetical protein FB45DRAFT_880848 [Roridomyces roridus]|uniref:Uncharacterized protein n=1 Tax=Roridomyces roridus TaxID=1738132 RepID=A0AAD7F668_9AGAR|nr:hypothetical protein FB45DRAFT_880848 [Roridomyces roridus]